MAQNDVKKIYQDVINDVCSTVREALSEEGYDDHTLQELKTLWLARLESSKALEPSKVSIVDEATTRMHRQSRTTTNPNSASSSSTFRGKQQMPTAATATGALNPTTARPIGLHPSSVTALSHLQTTGLSTLSMPFGSGPPTMIPTNGTQLSMGNAAPAFIRTSVYTKQPNGANVGVGNNSTSTTTQLDGANDDPNELIHNSTTNRRRKLHKKKETTNINRDLITTT